MTEYVQEKMAEAQSRRKRIHFAPGLFKKEEEKAIVSYFATNKCLTSMEISGMDSDGYVLIFRLRTTF